MPRNRYRFLGNDAPYLMTMTVNHWLAIFTRPQRVEIVLDSWRYLHGGSAQIGQDIQRFKSYRAWRIIDQRVAARAQRLLDLLAPFKRLHKSQCEHRLWAEGSKCRLG